MKNIMIKFSIAFIFRGCFLGEYVYGVPVLTNTNMGNIEKYKIIYLTFDDGPTHTTNDVLDVLEKFDVKATFFLIGNQIKGNEDIVKRINNEGHTIGLHTYTHKFKKIYSTQEAFISEINKTKEEVKRNIGKDINIIRFPWGSRMRHLTPFLLDELHSKNYKIYDWNIDSKDGIRPKAPPYKLFQKVTKGYKNVNPVILLMHCSSKNRNTYKALPQIIKFYKDKGYEFRAIDNETPEYYFKLKK
ncbi:polysaccharide deacetylase family protein [Clostridium peptidivorans]|uniref:polysaccharide deacetylase family protein n=1 Tax=Clostridium peptidivorans TaxID=100174 RepID=UPI000BE366FB